VRFVRRSLVMWPALPPGCARTDASTERNCVDSQTRAAGLHSPAAGTRRKRDLRVRYACCGLPQRHAGSAAAPSLERGRAVRESVFPSGSAQQADASGHESAARGQRMPRSPQLVRLGVRPSAGGATYAVPCVNSSAKGLRIRGERAS
jgi:hypothetical protein